MGFFGLVAICAALGYAAWIQITKPKLRPTQVSSRRPPPANDSIGFISVAGEGVELEFVAPDGKRTSTTAGATAPNRIAGSEATVDCPGFSGPGGSEADCTSSIRIPLPHPGDYSIIARANRTRAVVLNVGWGTASEYRHGGFDVRVQVAPGGATGFSIIVARDAVSQRSEPKPVAP